MRKWTAILFVLIAVQCREPYTINVATDGDGLLVVEGVVNANGKTNITLSRTTRLSDVRIAPETGAFLFIEGEDNAVYPLTETDRGEYESQFNVLNTGTRYRLKIQTADNREYGTDFKEVNTTPGVDSISWRRTSTGVEVFSNSNAGSGNEPYYKIDYEETWEFHSAYRAILGFEPMEPDANGNRFRLVFLDPVTESVDLRLFICYNERKSSNIRIVSTEALDSNVVFTPVVSYRTGAIELSVLYSILVRQYSLSKEGYEFFAKMKRNTEQLGSIFDAQPSELVGNLKCITDPSELVIGYVEVASMQEKRKFISNDELPDWGYVQEGCENYPKNIINNDPALFEDIVERGLVPTIPITTEFGAIKTFQFQRADCVDCRRRGSNVKPDFWP